MAGVDSAWEQDAKRLEATQSEMLAAGAARPTGSPTLPALTGKGSGAPGHDGGPSFFLGELANQLPGRFVCHLPL